MGPGFDLFSEICIAIFGELIRALFFLGFKLCVYGKILLYKLKFCVAVVPGLG